MFQGSSAITLSGTAISLDSSDIVIGASTIPFASVTRLGAALSSGLATLPTGSGSGSGPTATSTGVKEAHRWAAGRLRPSEVIVEVWLILIIIAITMV